MNPDKFVEGRPCRKGHTLKYKSTGNCVICHRAYQAKYQRERLAKDPEYRKRHIEAVRKYDANPGVRETKRKYSRLYYHEHKDWFREHYHRNREVYCARVRKYYYANRERCLMAARLYRLRVKADKEKANAVESR